MAEFQEVVQQYRRMCLDTKCSDCTFVIPCRNDTGLEPILGDPIIFEQTIMKWAAEHPEPVYPTWKEWMESIFPDGCLDDIPCPQCFDKNYPCCTKCTQCENQRIPEYLAVKLGIQKITTVINTDKITVDKETAERTKITLPNIDKINMEVNNDSCDCLR